MPPVRACPFCSNSRLNRSRRKGFVEKVFFAVAGVRPYRCLDCGTRFFAKTMPQRHELIRKDKAA
jgi:DNA-directed RNA polymerase subunit RPC12/RpoP